MGFLKKITRPISRALDKLVPNEIKPALPFLAAAAPFMAPGLMSLGGNTMFSRALMSGGLNLGSQLAQEGSDGDFSGLSTLMAAATGALSAPGTQGTGVGPAGQYGTTGGTPSAADYFSGKAAGMDPGFAKSGLGALETSSNYLSGVSDTLQNNLFSKEGLKAALIPAGQGMTDLAVAENRRLMKDYEREQADYEAGMDEENSNRAFAIRQSMESYGFTEQEILDAIEAAGYANGGRVGFNNGGGADFGGIPAAIENIKEDAEEMVTIMTDNGPIQIEKSVYESMPGMFMDTTTSAYGDAGRGRPVPQFADGGSSGMMGIAGPEVVSKMGDEIEKGVSSLTDLITDSEGNVYTVLQYIRKFGEDAFFGGQKNPELPEKFYNKLGDEYIEEMKKVKERGYKDGGLMNLGGREMDMRGGGFIPIGKKERADDVPARLSKNEFVMTADAVRAAGGGSVNEGAKRMYETMNRLEAKV